jgi:hypothetical protein
MALQCDSGCIYVDESPDRELKIRYGYPETEKKID